MPVLGESPSRGACSLAIAPEELRRITIKMSKAEKFVVVDSRILDFEEYRKDFALLSKIVGADLKEYLATVGFVEAKSTGMKSHFRNKMRFYNGSLDFELFVIMKKKGRFEFV